MKILGENEYNFIVELSKNEMAKLCGSTHYEREKHNLKPGREFDVHDMFLKVENINKASNRIRNLISDIRSTADSLEICRENAIKINPKEQ